MNKTEIIQEIAIDFLQENMGASFGFAREQDSNAFLANLRIDLQNFYDPESKMLFLDNVRRISKDKLEQHLPVCHDSPNCHFEKELWKVLFFIEQEISVLPKVIHQSQAESQNVRNTVFVSYSKEDEEWLHRLKRHFRPLQKSIDIWDNSEIRPGEDWKQEIFEAIDRCKVAILLISADFFSSDFIYDSELPKLLEAAKEDGAVIISLIVQPCLFEMYTDISQYQSINSADQPLSRLSHSDQELIFVELVKQVRTLMMKS